MITKKSRRLKNINKKLETRKQRIEMRTDDIREPLNWAEMIIFTLLLGLLVIVGFIA